MGDVADDAIRRAEREYEEEGPAGAHPLCPECSEFMMSNEEVEADLCEDCASEPEECSRCGEPTDPDGFKDGTVCYRCVDGYKD